MAIAVVHLLPSLDMYNADPADEVSQAKLYFNSGKYTRGSTIATFVHGEDAAEEVYDLANNPSRINERRYQYGTGRSVSVGDIVEVGNDKFLCCTTGWKNIK